MMKRELHRQIMNSVPIGYSYYKILFDDKGLPYDYECIEMNDTGKKIMGAQSNNIEGKRIIESMGKMIKKNQLLIDALYRVSMGEDEQDLYQIEYHGKKLRMKVLSQEKGYIINYFTDMTEDIKKEKEMEALLTTLNDIIFIINNEYIFIDVLTSNEKLLFIPKKEIIGKSINEIFDVTATKFFLDAMNKAREEGTNEVIEYPSVHENENKWFKANIKTIGKKEDTRYFINISDITEQKNLEVKANEYKNQLEKQIELQDLICELFTMFSASEIVGSRTLVEKSLQKIGKTLKIDRLFVFKYDFENNTAKPVYLWVTPKLESKLIELNEVPVNYFKEWNDCHLKGESVYIKNVDDIADGEIKNILIQQSLKSFLTVPLVKDNDCLGFIGFESIQKEKIYSNEEKKFLCKYADILVTFIKRVEFESKLKEIKANFNQLIK